MMKLIVSCLVCLALAGCGGYRPLYGTASDGTDVTTTLSAIGVPEQRSRTGQLVRNELLSGLGTGGVSSYELRLTVAEGIGGVSSTPSTVVYRKRFNLSVHYELVQLSSGKTINSGTSFSNVSYDAIREPVADLQAADNARVKATTQVGQDMRLRLAAFMATRKS